jgi:endonuclease YncB( thermonuclease family)
MKICRSLLIVLLFTLFIIPGVSRAWQGKVVRVSDGDTIEVLHNGIAEKIRLYGIDCPEKQQNFGERAKQFTSNRIFSRIVEIDPVTRDRYGRTVGIVYHGSRRSLNEELINNGYAWVYLRYCDRSQCSEWTKQEKEARVRKVGLWAMNSALPPWDFRRNKGSDTAYQPTDRVYHGNFSSKIFHKPGCRRYNCINCDVLFSTRNEALAAGYRPCGFCRP